MFEETNLSMWSVINMLQAVSSRHNLDDETQFSIFQMLKSCSGTPRDFSKHEIGMLLNPAKNEMFLRILLYKMFGGVMRAICSNRYCT